MVKSTRFTILMLAIAAVALVVTLQSSAQKQGQNSSTNKSVTPESSQPSSATNRSITAPPAPGQAAAAAPEDFSKRTWDIPKDADKTKNPVEATPESIAKGKELFLAKPGNCVFCHGENGGGNQENLAKLRRVPADLSDNDRMPKLSDGEIFWKITKGIPGIMPAREKQLTEEERWHVVNFVRTLAADKPVL
ncbi:MAG: cytochrome c [bacterium]